MKSTLRGAFFNSFRVAKKAIFMSNLINSTIVKKQLRVLHSRDDDYIGLLTKAALKHIQNFLDRPLEEVTVNGELHEDLTIAALLIITDMYENRAAQTEVNLYVNQAVEMYMLPYRKMGV